LFRASLPTFLIRLYWGAGRLFGPTATALMGGRRVLKSNKIDGADTLVPRRQEPFGSVGASSTQEALAKFDGPYHSRFNTSGRWTWWRGRSVEAVLREYSYMPEYCRFPPPPPHTSVFFARPRRGHRRVLGCRTAAPLRGPCRTLRPLVDRPTSSYRSAVEARLLRRRV
jgi:hypothetical protein